MHYKYWYWDPGVLCIKLCKCHQLPNGQHCLILIQYNCTFGLLCMVGSYIALGYTTVRLNNFWLPADTKDYSFSNKRWRLPVLGTSAFFATASQQKDTLCTWMRHYQVLVGCWWLCIIR